MKKIKNEKKTFSISIDVLQIIKKIKATTKKRA